MGWIDRGRKSGEPFVVKHRHEVFLHHVCVSGVCPQCGVPFNKLVFTKEGPDTAFTPTNFTCPCGTFIYEPEYDRVQTKDTGETQSQLRARYDATARKRNA
jgi:hypothetical protein